VNPPPEPPICFSLPDTARKFSRDLRPLGRRLHPPDPVRIRIEVQPLFDPRRCFRSGELNGCRDCFRIILGMRSAATSCRICCLREVLAQCRSDVPPLSIIFFRGIVDGMPGILYLNPLPSAARVVDDWGVQSSGPWSVPIILK
jgi:hypothetical protein